MKKITVFMLILFIIFAGVTRAELVKKVYEGSFAVPGVDEIYSSEPSGWDEMCICNGYTETRRKEWFYDNYYRVVDIPEIYLDNIPSIECYYQGAEGEFYGLPPSPPYLVAATDPAFLFIDEGKVLLGHYKSVRHWSGYEWIGCDGSECVWEDITSDEENTLYHGNYKIVVIYDDSYTPPPDVDNDGVPDTEEQGPDGNDLNYDGDNNGTPDSQEGNVASLHTHDNQDYVTLASSHILSNVEAVSNPSPSDAPPGVDFPVGFFEYTINAVGSGGVATVNIILPISPSTYYKYGPTPDDTTPHWYEFLYDGETGAEIIGNEVILHFVDGQRGDDDITENGDVVEPGGPGGNDVDSDSDGVPDYIDNCPETPNGPSAGTCTKGYNTYIGEPCTTPGENTSECGDNGFCSMDQEDNYPPSGNGCGDACECEGDFDQNGNIDAMDIIMLKIDFGRMDCPSCTSSCD